MQPFDTLTYDDQLVRLTHAAQSVIAAYGLSDAQIAPLLYVNNAVFQVTAGSERYTLRIHRRDLKQLNWIVSEMRWLEAICRDTALCVPKPLPKQDGVFVAETVVEGIEKPLHCTLLRWVDGTFYKTDRLTLERDRQVGAFLGNLHRYSMIFQPTNDFQLPRLDWEGLFGVDSPYNPGDGANLFTPEHLAVFDAVADRVRDTMYVLGETPENFGLIHADFIDKNYLFNGDTICAIDFDDCAYGYYLYDLAPPLLQISAEPEYEARKEALWRGYTAIRPQPEAYRDHLETFIAARHVASCRWIAGNLDNPKIRQRAPQIIAYRVEELLRFLQTGRVERKSEMF